MLIVGALMQAGFRRSHLLYLLYALAGLLLARTSLGAAHPPYLRDRAPTAWELNVSPVSGAESAPGLERFVGLKRQ